mgnify:CR=1 FL=1
MEPVAPEVVVKMGVIGVTVAPPAPRLIISPSTIIFPVIVRPSWLRKGEFPETVLRDDI